MHLDVHWDSTGSRRSYGRFGATSGGGEEKDRCEKEQRVCHWDFFLLKKAGLSTRQVLVFYKLVILRRVARHKVEGRRTTLRNGCSIEIAEVKSQSLSLLRDLRASA